MRACLFLAVLTLQASCAGPDEVPFADFDAAIEGYLTEHGIEGANAVVVQRDEGVVHLQSYGAFDLDRISLIASSGKILSAGVLLNLADQGLLDLDAPISEALAPAWGVHKTDITLAQLLSNSAGMVGLLDDPLYAPYLCQYLHVGTLTDCARGIYQADDADDRVPPDTVFRYGGGQWQLAGGIAEVVSGRSWAELIDEIYVQPCGLQTLAYTNQYTSAFADAGDVDGSFGYPSFFDGDLADLPATDNPSIEGGAYTTVQDYGEILLMHLRGGACARGRVLSEGAVARMQRDRIGEVYGGVTIDARFEGYGLGWWVSRAAPGVVSDAGAYGAMPWLDVERGYGAMILLELKEWPEADLFAEVQPLLDRAFDGSQAR